MSDGTNEHLDAIISLLEEVIRKLGDIELAINMQD